MYCITHYNPVFIKSCVTWNIAGKLLQLFNLISVCFGENENTEHFVMFEDFILKACEIFIVVDNIPIFCSLIKKMFILKVLICVKAMSYMVSNYAV